MENMAKERLRKNQYTSEADKLVPTLLRSPAALNKRNATGTIPLSPEVGDGGGVAAVMLCLSQTVSKIPIKKEGTECKRVIQSHV